MASLDCLTCDRAQPFQRHARCIWCCTAAHLQALTMLAADSSACGSRLAARDGIGTDAERRASPGPPSGASSCAAAGRCCRDFLLPLVARDGVGAGVPLAVVRSLQH
jgi:hypothetical protein